jgi:type IV pilus biogenesis protein PilP
MARMGETLRRRGRPEKPADTASPETTTARAAATPPGPGDGPAKKSGARTDGAKPRSKDAGKAPHPLDRAPARPAPVEAIVPASRPPASEQEKAREAEALTIFGARSGESGGREFNRRGLVLTAGLVVLLAALGIWVAYFADGPEPEFAEGPATTEVPADPVTAPPALVEATPDPVADEPPVPEETLAAPADEPPADEALVDEAPVAAPLAADERMEALVEEALSQGEPAAGFADPDATATPPEAAETGAPEIAADRPVARLALPGPLDRPAIDLPQLVSLPPPPPFGTEMQLGEDGLIVATPEGAITPEGVTVFTRLPAAVPPDRPEIVPPETDAAPEAEPDAAEVEDASAPQAVSPEEARETALINIPAFELEIDVTPGANAALADFRPMPRPAGEEPAAGPEASDPAEEETPVSESAEGTSLASAPAGAIELAALRPASRPDSLVQTATPPAEPEIDLDSATPQAVARSLRPNARPQGFAASVQRAIAAATQSRPEPEAAPAAPAAPAQTAATQPRIPTSASVADTATQRRAVNLRRVNLIGVFGSQANRRALVRMPNGQVVRVQVGDTLDGGRVSAIGDTELRYVRGGRNQILRVGQSG